MEPQQPAGAPLNVMGQTNPGNRNSFYKRPQIVPPGGFLCHRFQAPLTFFQTPEIPGIHGSSLTKKTNYLLAEMPEGDVWKDQHDIVPARGTPFSDLPLVFGVSLNVFYHPTPVQFDEDGNDELHRRYSYAHRIVHERLGNGLKCFVSADPAACCDGPDRQILLYWDSNCSFPLVPTNPSSAFLIHHLLASPDRPLAVEQLRRITMCDGRGWTPCTMEGAAGYEEEEFDAEPDQYLRVIMRLLHLVIDSPKSSPELIFAAASHQHWFYTHALEYECKPEKAMLVGSTAALVRAGLMLLDNVSLTSCRWDYLPGIRALSNSMADGV